MAKSIGMRQQILLIKKDAFTASFFRKANISNLKIFFNIKIIHQ